MNSMKLLLDTNTGRPRGVQQGINSPRNNRVGPQNATSRPRAVNPRPDMQNNNETAIVLANVGTTTSPDKQKKSTNDNNNASSPNPRKTAAGNKSTSASGFQDPYALTRQVRGLGQNEFAVNRGGPGRMGTTLSSSDNINYLDYIKDKRLKIPWTDRGKEDVRIDRQVLQTLTDLDLHAEQSARIVFDCPILTYFTPSSTDSPVFNVLHYFDLLINPQDQNYFSSFTNANGDSGTGYGIRIPIQLAHPLDRYYVNEGWPDSESLAKKNMAKNTNQNANSSESQLQNNLNNNNMLQNQIEMDDSLIAAQSAQAAVSSTATISASTGLTVSKQGTILTGPGTGNANVSSATAVSHRSSDYKAIAGVTTEQLSNQQQNFNQLNKELNAADQEIRDIDRMIKEVENENEDEVNPVDAGPPTFSHPRFDELYHELQKIKQSIIQQNPDIYQSQPFHLDIFSAQIGFLFQGFGELVQKSSLTGTAPPGNGRRGEGFTCRDLKLLLEPLYGQLDKRSGGVNYEQVMEQRNENKLKVGLKRQELLRELRGPVGMGMLGSSSFRIGLSDLNEGNIQANINKEFDELLRDLRVPALSKNRIKKEIGLMAK